MFLRLCWQEARARNDVIWTSLLAHCVVASQVCLLLKRIIGVGELSLEERSLSLIDIFSSPR